MMGNNEFMQLRTSDGAPVFVNLNNILYFNYINDLIWLTNDLSLTITKDSSEKLERYLSEKIRKETPSDYHLYYV